MLSRKWLGRGGGEMGEGLWVVVYDVLGLVDGSGSGLDGDWGN